MSEVFAFLITKEDGRTRFGVWVHPGVWFYVALVGGSITN